MRPLVFGAAFVALLSPVAAHALTAYLDQPVMIHAGPGSNYPVLEELSKDTRLWIHGCRAQFDWCDVSHGRMRGWVQGSHLSVPDDRASDGIPVASFDLQSYWSENYKREPFYGDRAQWADASRQIAQGR